MALQNSIDLQEAGISLPTGYWRIGELYWNTNNPSIFRVRFDGYASAEARHEGKSAVLSIAHEFPLSNPRCLELFNQVRSHLYLEALEIPGFENAVQT